MGVAEYRDLCVMAHCLLSDFVISLEKASPMAVGHEDPDPAQLNDPLIRRVCKEIIVACHIVEGDVRELLIDQLTSLEVAGMQEHVKIPLFGQDPQEYIVICCHRKLLRRLKQSSIQKRCLHPWLLRRTVSMYQTGRA